MIELEKLVHLQGAVLWLPCTILLFAASSSLYRRLNKAPLVNPTLLTIAGLVVLLASAGVPYKSYFESVAGLHYLLGTAVLGPPWPLLPDNDRRYARISGMRGTP